MGSFLKLATVLAIFTFTVHGAGKMPFPQAKDYSGCIKPNIGQATMNEQIRTVYEKYKRDFLREAQSTINAYYIYSKDTHNGWNVVTVSEAHGWGMVISVLMDDRDVFDGLLNFYYDHINSAAGDKLMGWKVYGQEWSSEVLTSNMSTAQANANSSASDGDMDIAYALLLASKQWEDASYKSLANAMIGQIYSYDINNNLIELGNWVHSASTAWMYSRPSDWMADHLRAFAGSTGESKWTTAADEIYDIYLSFMSNVSNKGLISDFVHWDGSTANGAAANFLESAYDGEYYTNAARVPWRIATDYAHYGGAEAKRVLDSINSFVDTYIGSATNVKEGYWLDGDVINDRPGGAAYMAPFVAAAIAGSDQTFLTNGWNTLYGTSANDAYQAAIKLQSMLLISGNWWSMEHAGGIVVEVPFDKEGVVIDEFGDRDPQTDIELAYGKEKYPTEPYKGGYGWMYSDWEKGDVLTSKGNIWKGEEWNGSVLVDSGNLDEAFVNGKLTVTFQDSSSLFTYFPNTDNNTDTPDFFDLSDMTGFTINAKGNGVLKVTFLSEDDTDTAKYWSHYSTEIALNNTMKKYEVLSGLLSADPFSYELENGRTWAKDGCKKAKGIKLSNVGGSNLDVEIESFMINGKNINKEDFGLDKDITPISGINVLSYGDWYSSVDKLGSSCDLDIVKNSNDSITSVKAILNRAAHTVTGGEPQYDAYVSLGGIYSGDFSGLDTIQVIYTSNKDFTFGFPLKGKTEEGGAHFITLPAAPSGDTLTKRLSSFVQPAWWAADGKTPVPMNAADITGVILELAEDSNDAINGTITLTSIVLNGANIDAVALNEVINTNRSIGFSNLIASNGLVKVNLNLNKVNNVDLSIVNTQGRFIANKNVSLKKGVNSISINMNSNSSGVYYMIAKSGNATYKQKFILR